MLSAPYLGQSYSDNGASYEAAERLEASAFLRRISDLLETGMVAPLRIGLLHLVEGFYICRDSKSAWSDNADHG
jgi:hypothetical protein